MRGEAVAWLVTGGRMFVDRAFISRKAAENSVAERKDGATIVPLYGDQPVDAEKDAPMTDEVAWKIWQTCCDGKNIIHDMGNFARAILAANKDHEIDKFMDAAILAANKDKP
jgi:hypothetical protein